MAAPIAAVAGLAGAGLAGASAATRKGGSSSKTTLPGMLNVEAMPGAAGLISTDPSRRNESFQRFMMNPEMFKAIEAPLSDIALGRTLDVTARPEVQQAMQAISSQVGRSTAQNAANLRSQFGKANIPSTGGSSALFQGQKQLYANAAQTERETMANMVLELLRTELQRQMQGMSGLASYQMTPLTMFSELAKHYSRTSNTSPNNTTSNILGALAPAVGSLGGRI